MTQPASNATTVKTQTNGNDGLFWVVAMMVVLFGLAVQQLPSGTLYRQFLANRPQAAGAALAVLAVLLLMMTFDFRRSSRRGYVPSSVRVRVAKSFIYGLAATVGLCVLLFAWRTELLEQTLRLGPRGAVLGLIGLPISFAAYALCLSPRQFTAAALAPWRDAARALLNSYDFVLGRTGTDWKTGGGDPYWYVLPEKSLYTNVYCLGGIGGGKTATVARPLLEQALFKYPGHAQRDKHVGIYLYDEKGNMADFVRRRARAAGRTEDLIVFEPGGPWTMNLLASDADPTALATKLLCAIEAMTDAEPNSYFRKMALEFLSRALSILTEVLGPGGFTLMDLYDFITDEGKQAKYLEQAKPRNSLSYRWFQNQWIVEDGEERRMLTKGFRADLAPFLAEAVAPMFCAVKPNFGGWKSIMNDGKIVVLSPRLGKLGRALGIFCMMDLQDAILRRTTPEFRKEGGNTERLIMLFLDEAWTVMNPGIAEFTALSRESRSCTVALHQGLNQVPEKYRDTMLGNFRTHVMLAVNDPLTIRTFSELFGTYRTTRKSRSQSSGFAGVENRVLTDAKLARAGGESLSLGVSETEVDEPRFTPDEIKLLPDGKAIAQMFDGRKTQAPTVLDTILVGDDDRYGKLNTLD